MVGKFHQEKIFTTCSHWQKFYTHYIAGMATFTTLVKICNTKIDGLGKNFIPRNLSAIMVLLAHYCILKTLSHRFCNNNITDVAQDVMLHMQHILP